MKQITLNVQEKDMFGRTLSCTKCSYNEECSHYSLRKIFSVIGPQKHNVKTSRPTFKLRVDDVWSDDENNISADENLVDAPGPSSSGVNEIALNLEVVESNIEIGSFILIRYEKGCKSSIIHQFLGVCQDKTAQTLN